LLPRNQYAAAALLAAGLTCGCGESNPQPSSIQDSISGSVKGSAKGLVDDWSTHHVKFSNPGTEADAIRNGTHDKWLRIVSDPRYQMQQLRRSAAWANRFAAPAPDMIGLRERHRPGPIFGRHFGSSLHRDWAYQIAPAASAPFGMYPAEYGSSESNASCSDYVVFGTSEAGSSSAANIVGFINLYDGLCPSSEGGSMPFEPTMEFAYDLGGGVVQTSPILSEDGSNGEYLAGPVWDAPIVDSTAETAFSEALGSGPSGGESVLMQATTSLANVVRVNMGPGGGEIYGGDFDNTYYSSSAGAYSGYMYFCGTGLISAGGGLEASIPVLHRVGFSSSGEVNAANDGNSYALGSAVYAQPGECTPLTEFYNASTSTDYLFLGVMRYGNPVNCDDQACIMSFVLGSSFPSGPAAAYSLGGSNNGWGTSGIIVDNDSSQTGASQIYFSNFETGNATQASQNGLN
jgi:hypothetical protein